MISVAVVTYNHEKFIEKTISSILSQKTEYQFEVIIGDDLSTDNTRKIIDDFVLQYPDLIKPIYQDENIGANANFVSVLNKCKGKYIAICEGDDYWTDQNKLQRQVDFLEENPDCTTCHHNVKVLNEETDEEEVYNNFNRSHKYSINELLKENTIATCSVMFRNGNIHNLPSWYYESPLGDYPLNIMNAQHGNIGYINEIMSVYRKHSKGAHGGESRIQNYLSGIQSRLLIGKNLDLLNHPSLRYSLSRLYRNLSSEFEKIGDIKKAKSYAWKRLIYSQTKQRKLAINRLFNIYLRYFNRKLQALISK